MLYRNKQYTSILYIFFVFSVLFFSLVIDTSSASAEETTVIDTVSIETIMLDYESLPKEFPLNITISMINQERNQIKTSEKRNNRGTTVLSAYIIRMSGTTCQLYLAWSGSDAINTWKVNNIKTTNLSLFSPVTYSNINNYYRTVTAASTGTAYVDTFSVPTNETQARVSASGVAAYYLIYGWNSALIKNGNVVIN